MRYFWYSVQTLLGLILKRPLLGTCVIPVLPDGQIVLIRRRDTGQWGLPGGLIDWGEDVLTATQRELMEETGLTVIAIERLVGVYSAPNRDPRFHSICVAVATRVEGTPRIADPREILDIKAFSTQMALQETLSHDHCRQLQDYLRGETVLA
ncbi:NUDIX hydrolase [Pseudanabaena sp. FACHB-2040]|uniref:NUDIX domain-containing protein n=1 Tax=Pseudanabaena sp. FACHB-2040 TaxID=2692859 RepID=UPI0016844EE4|nr:NUDIX hydrolase [Pseudanabaena sp. FACHB-2040]MBD0268284.1 NUDIX hydrolase [Cyanobacteria bacterium Co-bin8]MBD2258137.1 NUDIX hydrolase [Pseudanabaena sp. FACHB-2040]